MISERFILSLWPLTDDGQFLDTSPAWESEVVELPEAEAAYQQFTHAVAWVLTGSYSSAYNLSLDVLDRRGMGVCKQVRTLAYVDEVPAGKEVVAP